MKQNILTIALAVALLLTVTALATESSSSAPDSSAIAVEPETIPAGKPDPQAETPDQEGESGEPEEGVDTPPEEYIPDPVGSITFGNLERRMRENNYNLLALEETIASIEVIDYDKMKEDLRKGLNGIANAQWMVAEFGQGDSYTITMLAQQYSALRETFDDLKDGKIQEDNAAITRQLRNAQDQIVMAGESLYIALVELEMNDRGLSRSLTALDRTIQELELRYELGQISSLTLRQTRGGRASLVSGMQTLEMNLSNLKLQLELMIGAEQTGNIQLQALPQVTANQLTSMDLEADLAAAKEASYELFAAGRTLEDARQDYKDAGRQYIYNEKNYQYISAQHTWQAAQHTYNATVQNFENSFRTLYNQVKDYKQVLDASKTALVVEKDNYAVAQLKYSQGNLSQNALLDAEDKVKEAQDTVDGAAIDLFTAYHNYRWAVDYGIIN